MIWTPPSHCLQNPTSFIQRHKMCSMPGLHYLIVKIMTAFRERSFHITSWFPPTANQENIGSGMPTTKSLGSCDTNRIFNKEIIAFYCLEIKYFVRRLLEMFIKLDIDYSNRILLVHARFSLEWSENLFVFAVSLQSPCPFARWSSATNASPFNKEYSALSCSK